MSSLRQLTHLLRSFLEARYRFTHLRGEDLSHYQDHMARRAISFAVRRSPFFHRHYQGHDLANWRNLPAIDKALMMTHFSAFNTRGVHRERAMQVALRAEQERDFRPTVDGLTVGLSSGTSGQRGLFLVSPQEQATWAGFLLARTVHDLRARGYDIAFFLRSNSNLYQTIASRWLRLRWYDLMTPLEQIVAHLNRQQPNIVAGPPSLLGLLAEEQEGGRLRLKPERLLSVAEVLEPQDEKRLACLFAAPVHQIYQCTEGLLAASCRHGSLHLMEDLVAVQLEPLPEGGGRFTPIVTDLYRRTQPILRYRMGDVVALKEGSCACGSAFRVLGQVEGRCDDLLYFPKVEGGWRAVFPDALRRLVLLASEQIQDYQVFQEAPDRLRVHLAVAGDHFPQAARAVREGIAAGLAGYGCRPPLVLCQEGLIHQERERKRRRVRRLWEMVRCSP